MSIQLAFRDVLESDMPFLLQLRNATMNEHMITAGLIPDQENHMVRIHYHFESTKMIEAMGRPMGMLKVVKEGLLWELVQIQLDSAFQRKGLGRIIIQSVISEARENNAGVKLSVFKASPAVKLYRSLGFTTYLENEHFFEMQLLLDPSC